MAISKTKISQPGSNDPIGGERRLYQKLARTLIAAIRSGDYKVGEKLPGERELAAEYDVSRPTVREAIIALEVQGLVEVRIGSGAYVMCKAEAQDEPGFGLTPFERRQTRLAFDGEGAALAVTLIADDEIDELSALLRRIQRGNRTEGTKEQADHGFHMLVAIQTSNAAVALTIKSSWRLRQSSPESALRSGAPANSRAAMLAHFNAAIDHLPFATEIEAPEATPRSLKQTKARLRRARI